MKTLVSLLLSSVCLTHAVYGQTSVTVTNTPAQAVPVKDQYNGALRPVSITFNFASCFDCAFGYPIPAGKRLVIESYATSNSFTSTSGAPARFRLQATVSGQTSIIELPIAPATAFGATIFQQAVGALRMYGDPNTQLYGFALRTASNGSQSASVTLIGHLVDIP